MTIIINKSLMTPIYEQIAEAIKQQIRKGELVANDNLPSVRSLSRDLQVSALTVKKAYDSLEREGFIKTVHGKGSYVSVLNPDLIFEEQKKEIEKGFDSLIQKGRLAGLSDEELRMMFEIILKG